MLTVLVLPGGVPAGIIAGKARFPEAAVPITAASVVAIVEKEAVVGRG